MARKTLSHHEWLRRVSDYHSGGVSAAERTEIEAHLLTCTQCREALAVYQRFYRLLRSPLRLDGALFGMHLVTDSPDGGPRVHDVSTARVRPLVTAEPPSAPKAPLRRPRRGIRLFEAIAAVLVLTLLGGTLLAVHNGRAGRTVTPQPTITHTQIPPNLPSAGTVVATIPGLGAIALGGQIDDSVTIAATDAAIWVHNPNAGALVRIDPHTNKVVATIPVQAGQGGGVAVGFGSVWLADPGDTVSRVDLKTNKIVATIQFAGGGGWPLTVSPDAVWELDSTGLVRHIDPATNKQVSQFGVLVPTGISYGAGSVWVCDNSSATKGLLRVDPQTDQVRATIDVSAGLGVACDSVVAMDQAIWVVSAINGQPDSSVLERIDPATNRPAATILMPRVSSWAVAADSQGVWALDYLGNLYRVDPRTNQVTGKLVLPVTPAGIAVGAGSVWVANQSNGTLLRIAPAQ